MSGLHAEGTVPNGQEKGQERDREVCRGLEVLPDEILLAVVKNLETTRDLLALARTCNRMNRSVMSSSAWQDFVKTKFPDSTIPHKNGQHDWKGLAEALTYQTRCFDRRSIRFTAMYPARPTHGRGQQPFQAVVDVDYDMDSGLETLIWGAGEDIVARYRQKGRDGRPSSIEWRQLSGARQGLQTGGRDDTITMSIVKLPHLDSPAMLVGRDNGDLSLLSAQNNQFFGTQLASFSPDHAKDPIKGITPDNGQQLSQNTVMAVDVLNDSDQGLLAACTNLGVSIYHLPQHPDENTIAPQAIYNLTGPIEQKIWNAKWMGGDTLLALALQGTKKDPLQVGMLTPTGMVTLAAAKNARLHEQFDLTDSYLLVNSLQPVSRYPGMNDPTPLLLSSWKDGTVRLQDLRTPSPFDTVFQNNILSEYEFGSLMTYGSDRFIAGSISQPTICIFDFRMPKSYYHTTALDCGRQTPFPAVDQPFFRPPPDTNVRRRERCDPLHNIRCRYHSLSREIYHRPNAMYLLSGSLPDRLFRPNPPRVSSLAKSSDVSPNFYVGISGAVIEANLGPITTPGVYEPNFGFPEYVTTGGQDSGGYASLELMAGMMEVGDGLRDTRNGQVIQLPAMHSYRRELVRSMRPKQQVPPSLVKKNRLDISFQRLEDFFDEEEGLNQLFRRVALD